MIKRINRHLTQRSEMLSGISHDLRTPLTRLKLQLAMMEKKVILIDRFVDSTVAYQHYGFGINKNIIDKIWKRKIKRKRLKLLLLIQKNRKKKNIF